MKFSSNPNGAMGLDRSGRAVFRHRIVDQSHFRLAPAARERRPGNVSGGGGDDF